MAKRIDIPAGAGATALIQASSDGDVLELQNVSDVPVEVSFTSINLGDVNARGIILYPGQTQTHTGALARRAIYLAHSAGQAKPVHYERNVAATS